MAETLRLPALGPETVAITRETDYPGDFNLVIAGRAHWHSREDEFVVILKGEVVLISESGEQTLRAGDTAGFPASAADGHHLVNKSSEEAQYLEIGSRIAGDVVAYPDIDLVYHSDGRIFTNKRGEKY